ncbi:hypothetical protein [Aminipila terrae]
MATGKKSLEEIRREAEEIEIKPELINLDVKQIDEVVRCIISKLEAI